MPRCYFVKKPIQQYSNTFTILKSGSTPTTNMENEKRGELLPSSSSSSSSGNTTSVIVAISPSPQGASGTTTKTPNGTYLCASNRLESQEARGKWIFAFSYLWIMIVNEKERKSIFDVKNVEKCNKNISLTFKTISTWKTFNFIFYLHFYRMCVCVCNTNNHNIWENCEKTFWNIIIVFCSKSNETIKSVCCLC